MVINMKFIRKLGKSAANDAAQITLPRVIAQHWRDANCREIEMIFDAAHNVLVVTPRFEK